MLNQKGIGLAEVMVAMGITSVTMMGILSSQQMMSEGQRSNVQVEEAENIAVNINNLLSDPATCDTNFGDAPGGANVLLGNTNLTVDITDATGAVIFDVGGGTPYGNNKITINNIRFIDMGTIGPGPTPPQVNKAGRLLITFDRFRAGGGVGGIGGSITRNITMRMTMDGPGAGGRVIDCYSLGINRSPWAIDGNNIYNTNSGNVGIGVPNPLYGLHTNVQSLLGDDVGIRTAPVAGTALSIAGNTMVAGSTTVTGNSTVSGILTAGDINATNMTLSGNLSVAGASTLNTVTATSVTSNQFCIAGDCRTTFAAQLCPPGQAVTSQNVDGTVNCATPQSLIGPTATCGSGFYLAGYFAGGSPDCRALPNGSCGVGEYIDTINSVTGAITCKPVPPEVQVANCTGGMSLIGVSGGVPQCAYTRPTSQTCPAGQSITGFDVIGNAVCSSSAVAGKGCPTGQVLQGFDAAGTPICSTGSTSDIDFSPLITFDPTNKAVVPTLVSGSAGYRAGHASDSVNIAGYTVICGPPEVVTLPGATSAHKIAYVYLKDPGGQDDGFYKIRRVTDDVEVAVYGGKQDGSGQHKAIGYDVLLPIVNGQFKVQLCHTLADEVTLIEFYPRYFVK